MRAPLLLRAGEPPEIRLVDLPAPVPAPDQVLVRVRAAAVNFADVLILQGRYPKPPELPAVLGMEVAGDVVEAPRGSDLRPNDRVMALTLPGRGFAEFVAVDAATTFRMPAGMAYVDGAAFLLAPLTAWIPLTRQLNVGPGVTLLVHGAAGGVGSAAVQLAAQLGARVIATARGQRKLAVAADLGADVTIDYGLPDFAVRVREATNGSGVDAVLDVVGGTVLEESLRLLRPLGAVVAVGFAGGEWRDLGPALLVGRNVGIHGFYLARFVRFDRDTARAAVFELIDLWSAGRFRPLIGGRFPLDDVPAALELIAHRESVGKIVIEIEGDDERLG